MARETNGFEQNTKSILFLSHQEKRCGVYQFGFNISEVLRDSKRYKFVYAEVSGSDDYKSVVRKTLPDAIIYNYYPSTMPWLKKRLFKEFRIPHVGIFHEVFQASANRLDGSLFQFYIAPDPTLLLKNPIVYKTGRLLPQYHNSYPLPEIPTIGSFGFGLNGKGFERVIEVVQSEYEHAHIRLHIPIAAFGDASGRLAREIAEQCKKVILKPGIKLTLSHNFLSQKELLDFLAQNTMNAFFYDKFENRGISAVIDLALAVNRPIAITRSQMFRHVHSISPSILIEESTMKKIVEQGVGPLKPLVKEWNKTNLIWDYERIMDDIFKRDPILRTSFLKSILRKMKTRVDRISRNGNRIMFATSESEPKFIPKLCENSSVIDHDDELSEISNRSMSFNRILNNQAGKRYEKALQVLFDYSPEILARKIPQANIQQAFVLDSVRRLQKNYASPKILCVGSYEDSASTTLRRIGVPLEEIDPVLNYDLDIFISKPTTVLNSYDIIFSTSVLEHVENDELFVTQIGDLLSPGGVAIFTCDYNDQYKPGDRIPRTNFRFYTQKDFKNRLLPLLKDCEMVDTPQWNCLEPDFDYDRCRYTFATLVFRKKTEQSGYKL